MLLSSVFKLINCQKIIYFTKDHKVKLLTANSNLIKKNSIFVVDHKKKIKKDYYDDAIKRGAIAIITNKLDKSIKCTQLLVKNLNTAINKVLLQLKPFSPKNMVAITGTNGKTSVVWIISSILNLSNYNVSSLGTLGFYKNQKKIKDTILTTPEREEIFQAAFSSSYNNIEFIFEVSSHSISKKRIKNLPINIAAITNISQDHLDYHKTFKNYKNSKYKLFFKYLTNKNIGIINDKIKDINNIKNKLKKKGVNIISYGKKTSDVHYYINKAKIRLKIYSKIYSINYHGKSEFELQNLSCAVCCCLAIGLNESKILKSIPKIKNPEGRMQKLNSIFNQAKVFVDYAHTPEALKSVLLSKTHNNIKPNLVFGCGGDRDKSKRITMGKIANLYANRVYITNDNPRNEDPSFIRKKIQIYCPNAYNIDNRRFAIKQAISSLKFREILIIAGKGHEKKQFIKNKIIDFDDVKIANYFIKKRNYK